MTGLWSFCRSSRWLFAGLVVVGSLGMARAADDDDEILNGSSSTKKKGANSDVPDASSFKDEDDVVIPTLKPVGPGPVDKSEENLDGYSNASAVMAGKASKLPIETAGREPLVDNYPARILYVDNESVVVEMPVLYARTRAEFDGIAFWLVAEAYADGKRTSESRMYVSRDGIANLTPSVHFFQLSVPVTGSSGKIEVRVGKAASGAARATPLFTRTVDFKLGT